jgi:sugar/nucleoside kinase (ribokinase family)
VTTVLACGLAVLDVVQTVPHVPGPDEKLVASDLLVASGGPAANGAVTAAALLGRATTLVTRVGTGPLGALVTADLAAHGVRVVDLADPADPAEAPAVSTVLVTRGTGQRAVVSVNATRRTGAGPADAEAARLVEDALGPSGAGVLLVDGHLPELAVPVAAAARARGVPVLLDGGSWKPGLEALLAHVDVAVLSADLRVPAEVLTARGVVPADDPVLDVAALGPRAVARTRGADPIELLAPGVDGGGTRRTIPVPHVDVVDTLGAGDVLHGALAAWLAAHGAGEDAAALPRALAWAATVAAASVAAPGARGWLADPDLVTDLAAPLRA